MSAITVFKDFSETKKPYYSTVDKMLSRIKQCKIQKQIDELRNEQDKKKRTDLKKKLPCILWSGKFTERADKKIVEHSGFCVLDFDSVENLPEFKKSMAAYDFVYSAFISPSGDGLKVLVRIPANMAKHRGYYRGLRNVFLTLDSTSINESRICYESIDSEIYINTNAVEFTDWVEDFQKGTPLPSQAITDDYAKANIALLMIRNCLDGEKHQTLIKSSRLMGGYVSGGIISESEAIRLLEKEISLKNITDFPAAQLAIQKGINYGKEYPIEVKAYEFEKHQQITKTKASIIIEENKFDFVSDKSEVDEYLLQWRENRFQTGLSTGIIGLDKYFLLKRGNFNVFNGFDNVGKSTILWYLCLLSSMLYKWNWIILSTENRNGNVIKKLIEFYWNENITSMSEQKYKIAYAHVAKHFAVIKNEQMFNFKDVLLMAEKLSEVKKYDGVLIDPYNSLRIDLSDNSKLNTHEYHYEAASEMQQFAKKKDMCVYLNCHVVTKAMRDKTAPMKADTEGGGKFANKADDFVTIHRELQSDTWKQTQLHVRKIKEMETGGSYTRLEEPFILSMVNGSGFEDAYGNNAITTYHNKQQQTTLLPSNFLPEPNRLTTPVEDSLSLNDEGRVW